MSWSRTATLICLAVYWAALFVGTHIPGGHLEDINTNDKLLHFLGYCGLAFLLTLATRSHGTPLLPGMLVVAVTLAGYAAFDEWSQSFVPRRTSEVGDWVADMAGSLVGMIFGCLVVFVSGRSTPRRL